MPGMLTPEEMAAARRREGRRVRSAVPRRDDQAPRRRADDGATSCSRRRAPARKATSSRLRPTWTPISAWKSIAWARCCMLKERAEMRIGRRSDVCCASPWRCVRWRSAWRRRGTRSEPPRPSTTDPRVGLKPGLQRRRRGRAQHGAASSSLPKPEGFFDPKSPAGDADAAGAPAGAPAPTPAAAAARRRRAAAPPRRRRAASNFANSDLAFSGDHVVHRQLPRLQHLRRRDAAQAASCSRRSSARAARATCRSTATCCSCRWSRRAAASTAARRACRRR